jgi:O-antigen ligase
MRLSSLKFFLRYPIFLLAFGPPQIKAAIVGVDTSQAHFDIWNVISVGWISVIALRAILRLVAMRSILIPKQIQSVLKLAFFLGLLDLASVAYSPGRVISTEYVILYFFNLICMLEFIVDVYRNPPNWMQCIFQLRLVALMLFALVLLTLAFAPSLVMGIVPGSGIRLMGGTVASMPIVCPLIAIISAYTFLHSLESRTRAALFFLLGLAGTLAIQSRGVEISLLVVLLAMAIGWAKSSVRSAQTLIAGGMFALLIGGVVLGVVGGGRIWNIFNRGADTENFLTASGRTRLWEYQIEYLLSHPQGMGYIAGVRAFRLPNLGTDLHAALTLLGGTDNSYMEVLTDAGWLALALYLLLLVRTVALGWRFAKKDASAAFASDIFVRHPIRCALWLLTYCLGEGMESSVYVIPLRQEFYIQSILIAIILGVSANILVASRPRHASLAK